MDLHDYVMEAKALPPSISAEIGANIAALYEAIRSLPPLPEYVALHPDAWEGFRAQIGELPQHNPWDPPLFPTIPVRLDQGVPPGVARFRVAGEDRDVPLADAIQAITGYLTGR